MIAHIFSFVLFFISVYYAVKGSFVIAAGVMGFSILWYILAYIHTKYTDMINYISRKEGGKTSNVSEHGSFGEEGGKS